MTSLRIAGGARAVELKMQQTTERPKSIRSRRKMLALVGCLFLFIGGGYVFCKHYNLDAPSVSLLSPVDINWDHLLTERWSYTLHHNTRVAYLGFGSDGSVGATMGTQDGTMANVTGIRYQWRIKAPTRLELTDEGGVAVLFTFDLNALTKNSAIVTDASNGDVLFFARSYRD